MPAPAPSSDRRVTIPPFSGDVIEMLPGQILTIIDDEGGQVVDFFAESAADPDEVLSSGVTIDCNESLRLNVGHTLYSDRYRPMFELVEDTVGEHDLFHPCCRPEMYDHFYDNGAGHPSCLNNLNTALGRERSAITPVNLFMHTVIHPDMTISVEEPLSKAGDHVTLVARMPLRVALAACSVTESKCNSGRSTSITAIVSTPTADES
ncbi:urea carboxylase-associated family protein [Ammonicoccus fulvus]|uniref:Urea carboxylase-associated family protein n=1 Tax=Ammonicoccus fulvus TaxID=3138240 RepID=A0ABZ3FUV3_9ACTN